MRGTPVRSDQTETHVEWWTYFTVLAVPLVLVGTLFVVAGAPDPATSGLYLAVVVVHGGLLAGMVTGRLSLRTVGAWAFALATSLMFLRLGSWESGLVPPPANLGYPVAILAWFAPAFALSFLAFGWRRGVLVSAATYVVVFAGAGVASRVGILADQGAFEPVAYVAAGQAALIAVLWVFARKAEQLSATRAKAELLALQATTDPLTGLANRRRLDDELALMVAQARRYEHALSVVLIDLDHFKSVNDTHGHDTGDHVLVEAAKRLGTVVRSADLLGRWGGEEFLLLAPHTDHAAACALAERCRRAISDPPMRTGALTASLGVATLRAGDDERSLRRRADLAMYTAKIEGRNRVVGYRDMLDASAGVPGVAN